MPLTQSQVESAFRVKKQFGFNDGNLVLTDITNWASIGVNLKSNNFPLNTDVLRVNLKIISPTGNTIFKSSGFDSNNYSAATWNETQNTPYTSTYPLPTDTNGNYLNGNYTFIFRFQLITNSETIIGEVSLTQNVCACSKLCGGSKSVSITPNVDYSAAAISVTDTTNYGNYVSIVRSNTIYPPPSTPYVSQTTSATTNIYVNNLPTKRVVTGTWSAKITSVVTYAHENDVVIVCLFEGTKEFTVEADQICKMLCVMAKWRASFYAKELGKRDTTDLERAFALANANLNLGVQAIRCGKDPSQYFNDIYVRLGIDKDCDCGCDTQEGTPIVPTTVIDGQDGRTPEFRMNGTVFQWKYTDEVSWTDLIDFSTIIVAGQDGKDGTTVLINEPAEIQASVKTNTTTNDEIIIDRLIPANVFEDDGDLIEISYLVSITQGTAVVRVLFSGQVILFPPPFLNQIDLDSKDAQFFNGVLTISKYNSNSVLINHRFFGGLYGFGIGFGDSIMTNLNNMTVSGIDFSQPIRIVLNCLATHVSAVRVHYFIVKSKKIEQ